MATSPLSEQEIQFRKRARRRLVGAVALVLLMVTVLPMVLDDRQVKPSQPDIAISIPSQDGGNFTSRIVPVAPEAASQPAPASVELAPPLEKPDAPVSAKPVERPAPVAEPAKPESVSPARAEPAPKPVSEAALVEAPVKEASPAKPSPAKATQKKGAYLVQIGVFTEGPKAKELVSKLAAQGFHPVSEKLDTPKGVKIRLRMGPYATKQDAEAALAKLKSAGTAGMLVTNK